MKKKITSITFVILLGFLGTAPAADFSYSKVSLGYLDQTVEMTGFSNDLQADGYELTASFEVNKSFAVQFGFGKASGGVNINGISVNLDVDAKMLGFIFHAPVSIDTDVVLGAALIQGELKASASGLPSETEDMNGQQISVGVRSKIGKSIELSAGVDQSFIEDESDSYLNLGIDAYLSQDISLGISFSSGEDSETTYIKFSKFF